MPRIYPTRKGGGSVRLLQELKLCSRMALKEESSRRRTVGQLQQGTGGEESLPRGDPGELKVTVEEELTLVEMFKFHEYELYHVKKG